MGTPPSITDCQHHDDRRPPPRSALGLFANGKGDWLRWLVGFLIAGLLGWGSAQARMAVLEERGNRQFDELIRVMERIEKRIERLEEREWRR